MSATVSSGRGALIMLRRNMIHTVRNPTAVFNAVLFPVVMMLMFVFVFGGAFDVGVAYIDYATPGLIVMAVSYGLSVTTMAVNSDMTNGIINRLKVMDVSSGAVLTGHVIVSVLRSALSIAAIIALALAVGYRPAGGLLDWLGALGLITLICVATSWFAVALGLSARSPESAGMAAVPLIMLPFLSSAFVPAESMGPGVRLFAEYQPFTPIIETLRGLLSGSPTAGAATAAIAWCVGIGLVGAVLALGTFRRRA